MIFALALVTFLRFEQVVSACQATDIYREKLSPFQAFAQTG